MDAFAAAADFARTVSATPSIDKLRDALDDTCQTMGIRFYALSHHVDFASAPRALRLHNYPDGWQDWYDDHQFGISDPIHRASQCTAQGFYWRDVPDLIPLSRSDRSLLGRGRRGSARVSPYQRMFLANPGAPAALSPRLAGSFPKMPCSGPR
jgi:LuxR family quorum-sensing system transcriptional regulator CciR